MTHYHAIVNTPGYLPESDDLPSFDTPREAWSYLADELARVEDEYDVFVLDDPNDPEGPRSYSATKLELDARSTDGRGDFPGTVYGDTPGYEGDHDLGKAYSVTSCDESECEPEE